MDEEELQRLIADELKDLRKGGGLGSAAEIRKDSLLGAVYDESRDTQGSPEVWYGLDNRLLYLIARFNDPQRLALLNAFRLDDPIAPGPISAASDLMQRRHWFCRQYKISERTLIRREDSGIDKLSTKLAIEIGGSPNLSALVRQNYDPPSVRDHKRLMATRRDLSELPDLSGMKPDDRSPEPNESWSDAERSSIPAPTRSNASSVIRAAPVAPTNEVVLRIIKFQRHKLEGLHGSIAFIRDLLDANDEIMRDAIDAMDADLLAAQKLNDQLAKEFEMQRELEASYNTADARLNRFTSDTRSPADQELPDLSGDAPRPLY